MDPRTARRVGLVAIALGVAGDILFDGQALGINVPIAVGLALAAASLLRAPGARIDRLDLWLPPVALLAAAGVALRTDPPIVALDLALAAAATLAWMIAASGTPLTRRSVDLVAGLGIWAGIALGVGGVTVATRATADGTIGGASGALQRVVPIVRGLVLAVPVVVVLAALLASADQAFDVLIGRLIEVPIDVWDLGVRTIVVGAIPGSRPGRSRSPRASCCSGPNEASSTARRRRGPSARQRPPRHERGRAGSRCLARPRRSSCSSRSTSCSGRSSWSSSATCSARSGRSSVRA
jgi:hypothetical protein